MKAIKASELARIVGISRHTMKALCLRDAELAFKREGEYWIRLEVLAARPGMDIIRALTICESRKWIKATTFARFANISPKTMNNWCRSRPNFAVRIGGTWYLPIDMLARNEKEADELEKMCSMGDLGHSEVHNERQA